MRAAVIGLIADDVASVRPRGEMADGDLASVLSWSSGPANAGRPGADFVDREAELERVLRGLRSPIGPHFWLVVAPPRLGKTRFLKALETIWRAEEPRSEIRPVDLRGQGTLPPVDAESLVGQFFSPEIAGQADPRLAERVAKAVVGSGDSYLCLLDGAELLDNKTVEGLRKYFSEIDRLTSGSGGAAAGRVALVVASRLNSGWGGIAPPPRFEQMALTEFNAEVVQAAVRSLAGDQDKELESQELKDVAALVGALSAGVPQLVTQYLRWVGNERWHGLERLKSQELFELFGGLFVHDWLLPAESLVPAEPERKDARRQVVQDAMRLMVPYRVFTQSHLRQHLGGGSRLKEALDSEGWSLEDLWNAIGRTALLARPLNEPWRMIQPAIRKLLFRYFYRNDDDRAQAHQQALEYDRVWTSAQTGIEQVVGLTECLWQEASALRLTAPGHLEERLTKSALTLVGSLQPSGLYTLDELRRLVARRLREDVEFQDVIAGNGGLLAKLIQIATSA